jgi:hypothetical protein
MKVHVVPTEERNFAQQIISEIDANAFLEETFLRRLSSRHDTLAEELQNTLTVQDKDETDRDIWAGEQLNKMRGLIKGSKFRIGVRQIYLVTRPKRSQDELAKMADIAQTNPEALIFHYNRANGRQFPARFLRQFLVKVTNGGLSKGTAFALTMLFVHLGYARQVSSIESDKGHALVFEEDFFTTIETWMNMKKGV